jgi:hypothetical protein
MNNQYDLKSFNSFLDKATAAISCDADCQREKTINELKAKLENAESNLNLADPQFQMAKRNYYTYIAGESGYNEMMEKEVNKQAVLMIESLKTSFQDDINKIKSELQSYNALLINFRNVNDLYKKYRLENKMMYKELKEDANDILTDQRKTYYEDQRNESLNGYYYYFLWIIYIIVFVCLIVFSLIYPSQSSAKQKIVIIVFFLVLPFISTWLLGKIIYLFYLVFNMLPKNVYK